MFFGRNNKKTYIRRIWHTAAEQYLLESVITEKQSEYLREQKKNACVLRMCRSLIAQTNARTRFALQVGMNLCCALFFRVV